MALPAVQGHLVLSRCPGQQCQELRHTNLTFTQCYMLVARRSTSIHSASFLMQMMARKTKNPCSQNL